VHEEQVQLQLAAVGVANVCHDLLALLEDEFEGVHEESAFAFHFVNLLVLQVLLADVSLRNVLDLHFLECTHCTHAPGPGLAVLLAQNHDHETNVLLLAHAGVIATHVADDVIEVDVRVAPGHAHEGQLEFEFILLQTYPRDDGDW